MRNVNLKCFVCMSKEDLLMARWRYPSLSIHGIEGGFSEPGSKTVIPRKVIGKFSIRLVPYQKPDKVENIVRDHLIKQWKLRGSSNSLKVFKYIFYIFYYIFNYSISNVIFIFMNESMKN